MQTLPIKGGKICAALLNQNGILKTSDWPKVVGMSAGEQEWLRAGARLVQLDIRFPAKPCVRFVMRRLPVWLEYLLGWVSDNLLTVANRATISLVPCAFCMPMSYSRVGQPKDWIYAVIPLLLRWASPGSICGVWCAPINWLLQCGGSRLLLLVASSY